MDDNGDQATRSWRSNQNHGRELMPAIIDSLTELSLAAPDITHVGVALGPGGFSAVRVGISAVLGLTIAKQLPVLGILTHDIEAKPYISDVTITSPLYSLIPAGRNEISWKRHDLSTELTIGIASPEELSELLEPAALICGEACDLMAGLVDQSQFRGHEAPTRDPKSIIEIAAAKFNSGSSTPYEELRPVYARPPSITKPKTPK